MRPRVAQVGKSLGFKEFVRGLFNGGGMGVGASVGGGGCVGCSEQAGQSLMSELPPVHRQLLSENASLFKGRDGRLRVYFRASNNYKDLHSEIITEAAHKDYEHFVDTYEQFPELWLWHTKGSRWGKADIVTYADGFQHVFGVVDPGCEDIARNVVKSKCAVSHGFLTFNQKGNVISKYRSWEISALPSGSEANPWFTGVNLVKELDMGFAPAKRAWMESLGVPSDMIKALEQESEGAKSLLDGLGVESKAVDKPKPEAGVAGQSKRKRPDQLHTAVGQDDNDNDTEPDDDEDDAPTRKNPAKDQAGGSKKELGDYELAVILKSFSDRLGKIEERLAPAMKEAETADDYIASLRKAAGTMAPTRKDAGNELDPGVASELEALLGRPVTPGAAEEGPNGWFKQIVGAVEKGAMR